eukprot:scaffold82379_cov67-Phaeocystis_antarctica.AAC.1
MSVDCGLGSLWCPASLCHESTCLSSLATKGLSIQPSQNPSFSVTTSGRLRVTGGEHAQTTVRRRAQSSEFRVYSSLTRQTDQLYRHTPDIVVGANSRGAGKAHTSR